MTGFPRIPGLPSLALLVLALLSASAFAQSDVPATPEASASAPSPLSPIAPLATPTTLLPPPLWRDLGLSQKVALGPLERDWDKIDATQRSKWLEMVPRFFTLPAGEQKRLHERMRAWSRLSPAERQQARVGFQVAQQLTSGDRQAKWDAYQALTPEQRQELADKAAKKQALQAAKPRSASADEAQAKSNRVPATLKHLAMKPVAPSVLQAKPGATTVLITQAKTPPSHQLAGQTKVLANPDLVDSKTLLPKRRPQAAPPEPR